MRDENHREGRYGDDEYDPKHRRLHNKCETCKALGLNNECNCRECTKHRLNRSYYKL